MAKPEWGRKITCSGCGAKFYDMNKTPAVCPSCGAENDPFAIYRPKRSSTPKPAAVVEEKPKADEVVPATGADTDEAEDADDEEAVLAEIEDLPEDTDDDDDLEDEGDKGLMEDTADLDEDDDLDEVREHMEPDEPKD